MGRESIKFISHLVVLKTASQLEERNGQQSQPQKSVQKCFQCSATDHLKNQCPKRATNVFSDRDPIQGGSKEQLEVQSPPLSRQAPDHMRQQALCRPRATTLTNRPIKKDSDSGHLLNSASVISANVPSDMSCLNVHAPVFQPVSVSNDSVSLCFSPERGVLSWVDKEGGVYRSSIRSASRCFAATS